MLDRLGNKYEGTIKKDANGEISSLNINEI
jgi:hypothetical protein